MNAQEEVSEYCPYCGEPITLLIDCTVPDQAYIEDCEVCCRPINIHVVINALGIPEISLRHENE